MIRTYDKSVIAVWPGNAINDPELRAPEDKDVQIVQCEPGTRGDYIVEFLRGGTDERWPR